MKKILFLISGLDVGGAEKMLYRIATLLDKKKFKTIVCSISTKSIIGKKLEKEGIPVYALECTNIFHFFSALKKLKKIIKEEQPDIINSFMVHANVLARFAKQRKALICAMRGNASRTPFLNIIDSLTQYKVDLYTGNAKVVKDDLIKYGIKKNKIKIIPNGMDIAAFLEPLKLKKDQIRKKYNIQNHLPCVSVIANLRAAKDHETVLKSFAKAKIKANLLLAGDDFENRKNHLKELAQKLGIENHVYFLGHVKEIKEILKITDIWFSATLEEGQSNALIEAMLYEKPVITTKIPGNQEVVTHKKEALLYKTKDYITAAHYLKVLVEDNKKATELAKQAKKKAMQYDIQKVIGFMEKMYEEI